VLYKKELDKKIVQLLYIFERFARGIIIKAVNKPTLVSIALIVD
jgi:hypothetical protein